MRTGLVLGAGGVVGASWLVGALQALRSGDGLGPLAGRPHLICLNPMSSRAAAPRRSPGNRLGALIRSEANRRLAQELRRLRDTGAEVVVLEPTQHDLRAMGWNLMARGRCADVVETAAETTSLVLRRLRDRIPAAVVGCRTPRAA